MARSPSRPPGGFAVRTSLLVLAPLVGGAGATVAVWMATEGLVPAGGERALAAVAGGSAAALLIAALSVRALQRPWRELTAVAEAHRNGRLEHRASGRLPVRARYLADTLSEHADIRSRQQASAQEAVTRATARLRSQYDAMQRAMRDAEARSEDHQRALQHQTTLLAGLSHELRTPLGAILGHADRLRRTETSREGHEHAESLHRCAQNLLGMINDLLDWSRIAAGALNLHEVSFDLADTIEDALALIAPSACDKDLELVHFIYHDVPTRLRGDPARLQQIMTNLLSNAVKYTDHGEIVLRVMRERDENDHVQLRLTVSDTGMGIAADRLDHLFDAYSPAASGKPGSSTGLGLSIVRSLAQAMQGDVDVQSEPGRGSTFGVTIRLERQREQTRGAPLQALRGSSAWLLEPSATARLALTHSLDYWGVTWRTFDSADALAEALRGAEAPPTFVLLGLTPAELSERSILTLLDTRDAAPARVVLLRSASPNELQQALRCGADVALPKSTGRSALYRHLCAAAVGHEERAQQALTGLRFLVADNSGATRGLIAQMLRELGADVLTASDGDAALGLFEQELPDGALLDLHMPGYSGLEVMQRLRARDGGPRRAALVLMSAWFDADEQRRAALAGADVVISKPFDARQLLRALSPWLRQRGGAADAPESSDAGIDTRLLQDAELRQMLAEELPEQLAGIERSFADADRPGLREAAHALHGTAAFYHLHRLKAQAARVERGAQQDEGGDDMHADISELRRGVEDTLRKLRAASGTGD